METIGELLQLDHELALLTTSPAPRHPPANQHAAPECAVTFDPERARGGQERATMLRYACMALTNLTFGAGVNKALLCARPLVLRALVALLASPDDDLCQVSDFLRFQIKIRRLRYRF